MRKAVRLIGAASVALLLLAGCSSDDNGAADSVATTTTIAPEPIQILVTNDDGVDAEGIDAVVEGLRTVEGVQVTVVAPATNQSGSGGNTTEGPLTVTDATTKSGYPAKAVTGFPADTIVWAIDQKGIDFTPDLVVSGINAGQNMGPVVDLSGTVGAARAAVTRGIPALAASQGLGDPLDFTAGRQQVLDWLEENMAAIADGTLTTATVANLNIPTCTVGQVRGQIDVPPATSADGYNDTPNCESTVADPTDDIQAYLDGFAPLSALSPTPAS
jgi:5'-nucleotidase